MEDGWLGRSLLVGALLAFAAVIVSAGAFYLGSRGGGASGAAVDRVLVVFECPDGQGTRVAWVAYDVDLAARTVTAVDTSVAVTVSGTAASTLRDSYPFGGPAAVGAAYSRVAGVAAIPVVAVSEASWRELLGEGAGTVVELPGPVNVFAGGRLTGFERGPNPVTGSTAPELLAASSFLGPGLASSIRAAVADATRAALAGRTSFLREEARSGTLRSNTSAHVAHSLAERADGVFAGGTYLPAR